MTGSVATVSKHSLAEHETFSTGSFVAKTNDNKTWDDGCQTLFEKNVI